MAKSYGLVSVCKGWRFEGGRMLAAKTHVEGSHFPEFLHQASSPLISKLANGPVRAAKQTKPEGNIANNERRVKGKICSAKQTTNTPELKGNQPKS